MIDTVNFWIDSLSIPKGQLFGVVSYLSEVTERQNINGYSCSGKAGYYYINVAKNGISLKGSLSKYYLGNNIDTLTRHSVKSAIEQLSDHLHIDISLAKVTRLDISSVILTKYSPVVYYRYLGQKSWFYRFQFKEDTLYYNNHKRQIIFYDKAKEAKSDGVLIPEIYTNANLFRYELRYIKRLEVSNLV